MLVHPSGCREAASIVEDLGVVVHTKDEPMTRYQAEQIVLWDLPFLDLEK